MATITLDPATTEEFLEWGDASVWSPQVVPDASDVDVVAPTILVDGSPQFYELEVHGGIYSVRSLSVAATNRLSVYSTLSVSGDLTDASNLYVTGTLDAGALQADDGLIGSGVVDVSGAMTATNVVGDGLSLTAGSLTSFNELAAYGGDLTVHVSPGGFADYDDGALTGGAYQSTSGGALDMDVGGVLDTLGGNLDLAGGEVAFFDAAQGRYVDIADTLRTLARGGVLHLTPETVQTFQALDDHGQILLDGLALFDPATLSIGDDGVLTGANRYNGPATETVAAPVVNDGVIAVEGEYFDDHVMQVDPTHLLIAKTVTGSGEFAFVTPPPDVYAGVNPDLYAAGVLELQGEQFQNVVFNTLGGGTLQLDDPRQYSGKLVASQPGANYDVRVDLRGVDFSAVTGYAYAGDATSGQLVVKTTAGDDTLNFVGDFAKASFKLSADAADPSMLDIEAQSDPTPPTITGDVAARTFVGAAAIAPFDAVLVQGSGELTAKVALGAPLAGALSLADPLQYDLSGYSYDPSTEILTLSGAASALSAAVDNVIFTPTFAGVAPGQARPTTFRLVVANALGSASAATQAFDVNGVDLDDALAGDANGFTTVYDSPSALSSLSAEQIARLAGDGITRLTSSGDVTYGAAPSAAIAAANLTLGAAAGDSATERVTGGTVRYEYNALDLLVDRVAISGDHTDTLHFQSGSVVGQSYVSYEVRDVDGQEQAVVYFAAGPTVVATESFPAAGVTEFKLAGPQEIFQVSAAAEHVTIPFAAGFHAATVQGFDQPNAASDVLDVASLFSNFAAAQAAMTNDSGTTVLTDSHGDALRIVNVAPSQLTAAQLGFG